MLTLPSDQQNILKKNAINCRNLTNHVERYNYRVNLTLKLNLKLKEVQINKDS